MISREGDSQERDRQVARCQQGHEVNTGTIGAVEVRVCQALEVSHPR